MHSPVHPTPRVHLFVVKGERGGSRGWLAQGPHRVRVSLSKINTLKRVFARSVVSLSVGQKVDTGAGSLWSCSRSLLVSARRLAGWLVGRLADWPDTSSSQPRQEPADLVWIEFLSLLLSLLQR